MGLADDSVVTFFQLFECVKDGTVSVSSASDILDADLLKELLHEALPEVRVSPSANDVCAIVKEVAETLEITEDDVAGAPVFTEVLCKDMPPTPAALAEFILVSSVVYSIDQETREYVVSLILSLPKDIQVEFQTALQTYTEAEDEEAPETPASAADDDAAAKSKLMRATSRAAEAHAAPAHTAKLQKDLKEALEKVDETTSALFNAQAEIARLEEDNKRLTELRAGAEATASAVHEVEILEQELTKMKRECENLKTEKRDVEKKQKALQDRFQDEEDEKNSLKDELNSLQGQIDRYKRKVEDDRVMLERAKKKEEEAEEYMKRLIALEEASQNVVQMKYKVEQQAKSLDAATVEANTLREANASLMETKEKLEAALTAAEKNNSALSKSFADERAEFEARIVDLERKLKEAESTTGLDMATKEEILRLQKDNELLRKQLPEEEASATILKLESELQDATNSRDRTERILEATKTKLASIQAGGADSESTAKLKALEEQVKFYQTQIENMVKGGLVAREGDGRSNEEFRRLERENSLLKVNTRHELMQIQKESRVLATVVHEFAFRIHQLQADRLRTQEIHAAEIESLKCLIGQRPE